MRISRDEDHLPPQAFHVLVSAPPEGRFVESDGKTTSEILLLAGI